MFGSTGLCCSRIWNHSLFLKRCGNFRASFSTNFVSGKQKWVGTHNGTFHCDETLACFILRLSSKFSDAQIVRTRDHQVLEKLDATLDVGGVYDPQIERYDHHQKGFTEVFGHGLKIIINERTRQSLGYGYVWFKSKEDAQLAVEAMNGKV